MSITYLEAEDEVFGVFNVAWNEAVTAAGLSYVPQVVFPDIAVGAPDASQVYVEVYFQVVTENQTAMAQQNGQNVYQSTALFNAQIFAPKQDPTALRIIKIIGEALKDAFRVPSPSGEVWFRNQRLSQVAGNATRNQVNVVTNCVYKTIK